MTSYRAHAYGLADIVAFLRAVDRHLHQPTSVVIIGGAAAAFHRSTSTTNDVDTNEALTVELRAAIGLAADETGLHIPMDQSTVAQMPWNFEDRLERRLEDLSRLQVWILDRHDLVLSKVTRGSEHDERQIQQMHAATALDFDVLLRRFRDEMDHVVGDPARIRGQFIQLVELLFGELKRVDAERILCRDRS